MCANLHASVREIKLVRMRKVEALVGLTPIALAWVKAVWRAFGGGFGLAHVIWFVNRTGYKTPFCELQNLRR